MESKLKKWGYSMFPSFCAIFIALIIGGIVIYAKGANPIMAYGSMIKAAFYQTSSRFPFNGLAKTLVYATPLLYSSLAVMFAFKSGLFNIGVQGQMIAGGLGATVVGVYFHGIFNNIFLALLVAALCGFILAGIAGFLKAILGINEVICTIMLNYIMAFFQNYLLTSPMKDPASSNTQTLPLAEGVRLPTLFQEITKQYLNVGFILAIFICIGVYYFFKSTTLGYKIKAVGHNITASENAGINTKLIAFLSMGIAGAIAGIGGAERVMGGSTKYIYTDLIMGDFGFTGIAVALLGRNHPIGIIFAAIFYAALEIGGQTLQLEYRLDKEIVYIIQAIIIILVTSENAFKYFLDKRREKQ